MINPVFVKPRIVERDWGRFDVGQWRQHGSGEQIGEAWLHDFANVTDDGILGKRLAANTESMLGDIGRAPPKVRMVFPGVPVSIPSTGAISLWTVIEPGNVSSADGEIAAHRPGVRIRGYEGAAVKFAGGSVALEVSSSFLPTNDGVDEPFTIRLPPVSLRSRATLFRDAALSVESWRLPEQSRIIPDGETCHVLTALTSGVSIDGRRLPPGQAVFIPAAGRPLDVTAAKSGARVVVAYPDATPTDVWRHTPSPEPETGQLPKPTTPRPLAGIAMATPNATHQVRSI